MRLQVHSWALALGSLLLPLLGHAQCPTAASCAPGAATSTLASAYQMGIYKVVLGSINNTTAGYSDGYKDYSCTIGTNLTVGAAAGITVTTGTNATENVRVWIDYNNDGIFASTEQVFSSDNAKTHTGSITPPASAVLNTRLRMRVAADYYLAPTPTACSTPQYSQDEDYAVTLVANSSPPVAAFTQDATTTCSGCVQFTDQSTNVPTSWLWSFGDNTTSTSQNPQHCYTTAGTYQVTLQVTNAAGTNTSAARTITYTTAVPVSNSNCPGLAASSYCCNYGITQVKIGTAVTNASADGSAGYQNFTCTQRATLQAGVATALTITTGGTNNHDTRAWIDYNNDGAFSASEQVLEVLNNINPAANITAPGTAVQGQPLRLRIVADAVGSNPQPCAAPTRGQVEDYTVTITPNTTPPVAAFTSSYVAGACSTNNTYTFTDQSTNAPTSWLWTVSPATGYSFVGGTSATSQNPQIQFTASGYYSVSLKATNTNGTNTLTKTNYILVQIPCPTYCVANGGFAGNNSSGFYITNVAVTAGSGGTAFANASANSTTTTGTNGYTYYTTPPVGLTAGATQTITVTTNVAVTHRTSIWIDYNRDGTFSNTNELVANVVGTMGTNTATASITVPTTIALTRMRVLVALDTNTPNPCATNFGQGEVEDYIVTPNPLASAQALALPGLTLSPNPTLDGEVQLSLDDPAQAGRYDVVVENLLGAQLLHQPMQLSAAQPARFSLAALPAGLYLVRLTSAQGLTALRRVVRQ